MSNKKSLFEKLFRDYQAMVRQMCLGFMKGDEDDAQDLAQEVFINTWSALDSFKNTSSHKTWIYRITVNTCLKYIRDKKAGNQIRIDLMQEQIAEPENQSKQSEQQHQSLYRAIGQLSEVDRLVIMMVLDELDYKDIASVIGINEGNLRVKIHRIKKNLKKILEND
ncbi:MAG: RNA polymerase sigma factor [Cyclobacteriaceae bacterium]